MEYTVILLDQDGNEITSKNDDTIRAAKRTARYLLSDAYARQAETTHYYMGTHKVEVRNERG